MEAVTQIQRKSLIGHTTGHHNVFGWDVRKSQESCTVPVSVPPVNTRDTDTVTHRVTFSSTGGQSRDTDASSAFHRMCNPSLLESVGDAGTSGCSTETRNTG